LELELNDEEAAVLGEALECLIAHPVTDDDTREVAIDLAHHLLALAAGHFDDWGDTEQDFVQQGIEAREQVTSRAAQRRELRLLSNDPIDW
jgi:hypothetical protein